MIENSIQVNAGKIRDVIRYIRKFRNATVVIYIDDSVIESSLFSSHIKDISLLHEAGLRVIIVPGAHRRIDSVLSANNIQWTISEGCRITNIEAMPYIKTAAFDISNIIMTSLAGEHLTAVIGNWVRARGKGVIDGIDYGTSGEIDKLEDESIRTILDNGFIPIFPCIGWSITGKPYNISSIQLATEIAIHLKADKLFFLMPDAEISAQSFKIPSDIGLSQAGCIPAMNIEELDDFFRENNTPLDNTDLKNKTLSMLKFARTACTSGVTRVHILNSSLDGTLPCEIFSDLGSGTMIYANNYGKIREMHREDIPAFLTLIRPFVQKQILLPRTEKELSSQYTDYIVYEFDGGIRACAALHIYDDNQAEIAAVAVDDTCSHIGIGPKMISFLVNKAKKLSLSSVFVLTTQTADWFEKLGFTSDEITTLPMKRKEKWTPERGSKLLRLRLQ
jgi:amino-acid N-acetyltransferase